MANRITSKILDALGLEKKSDRPQFPLTPEPFTYPSQFGWGWGKRFSRDEFKRDVGDLDTSSLVMSVCNWTGMQLPEAKPAIEILKSNGETENINDHPCIDLIRRPNPYTIWADDCLAGAVSWWIDGNWYELKVRDIAGQVVELWYLPHFMVRARYPGDGGTPTVPVTNKTDKFLSHYQYTVPGRDPVLYPKEDVLHIKRGKNLANPRYGVGAFEPLITEVYGDKKAAVFAATILKNMGIVVPMLVPKDSQISWSDVQAKALKEKWIQQTTGDNVGSPLVSDMPFEAIKFAFSPQELDLKELRKVPESRIAAITGIPAPLLQFLVGLENGTSYAAYAQAREQGYESVIIPIQRAIAEQLTWQLLRSEFDGMDKANLIFDVSDVRVLQEDRDAKYKRTSEAFRAGITTLNEARASIEKSDLGTDGDIYLVPSLNTPMTFERLKEAASKEPTPAPAPAPIDPASLAKFADIERWIDSLEEEMKGFINEHNRQRS